MSCRMAAVNPRTVVVFTRILQAVRLGSLRNSVSMINKYRSNSGGIPVAA